MCGRYTSTSSPSDLARYFSAEQVAETVPEVGLAPSWNVAPTDDVYAVVESRGSRRVDVLRWGLVPMWAKDPKIGSRMINARAESLASSNAFRFAFERRRCLLPADGFYEWQDRPGKRRKQPFYVYRRDGEPLAIAALWEVWRGPERSDEAVLRTCTVITGEPNDLVGCIHDRMPVLLPPSAWDAWLDRENHDVESLQRLLVPAPSELLAMHPVGAAVNDVRANDPSLVAPVEPEEDGEAQDRPGGGQATLL